MTASRVPPRGEDETVGCPDAALPSASSPWMSLPFLARSVSLALHAPVRQAPLVGVASPGQVCVGWSRDPHRATPQYHLASDHTPSPFSAGVTVCGSASEGLYLLWLSSPPLWQGWRVLAASTYAGPCWKVQPEHQVFPLGQLPHTLPEDREIMARAIRREARDPLSARV